MTTPSLVWFRQDLRLEDNPALAAAVARGGGVVPVFLWCPKEEGSWTPGAASRWWLHQSLRALDAGLRARGSRLILRRGPARKQLEALALETGAGAVFWNRRYEPVVSTRDEKVQRALRRRGLIAESFNGALLWEPGEVSTRQGRPFRVYTPFWKACSTRTPPEPEPAPDWLSPVPRRLSSLALEDFDLEPRIDWAAGIRAEWTPGEDGARERLDRFAAEARAAYAGDRDRPDREGTSCLSPHLHFGEISPRSVWHRLRPASGKSATVFLEELAWREFAHHLLHHFPHTPAEPLREEFARFPWRRDPAGLRAWRRGRTGYPLVDAGMRQLWATGWMHNRVRMVVASFLVKHLLLPWQEGTRWFWDTLVDADLANNTLGWQWTAGCGADAAPYFRVFNPVRQGERFDPAGDYVRRWVPELARLEAPWVHRPWAAPAGVLRAAGVRLGEDYPAPIVDHATARARALEAYARLRQE
jgi:deoxyribodipyrimidine photo-lyase